MNNYKFYSTPFNTVYAEGICGNDLTWRITNNILHISGNGDMNDYFSPWYAYKNFIERIVIDEGVTGVGEYAFYNCTALTEIIVPSTLKRIGDLAFYSCDQLREIIMPDGVESIGENSFKDCSALWIICKRGSYTDGYAADKSIKLIYK